MDLNKTPRLLIMMFIQYFMQSTEYDHGAGIKYLWNGDHNRLILCLARISDNYFTVIYWYGGRSLLCITKVMAILHLVNAGVLLFVPQFIEAQNTGMTLTMIFRSVCCFIRQRRWLTVSVSAISMGLNISHSSAFWHLRLYGNRLYHW